MLEVIIGKEGTQRFAINGSRVSRQHAKITVTDSGQWILEDLNSTNGTYIINENYLGDDWTDAHLAVAVASEGIWSGGDSRVYHYTTGFHQHIYR